MQVFVRHEAGCESIIHAMHKIYEDKESKIVLLVDASKAFNSVNWENISKQYLNGTPLYFKYVQNCYNLLSHFSSLVEGKFNLMKGQFKATPIQWQFTQ